MLSGMSRNRATSCPDLRRALALAALLLVPASALTQDDSPLPRTRYRNGEETLRAFASVAGRTRDSIAKLNVDGQTVALATVVGANGLALSKASELKPGRLTAWLAGGEEVDATVLGVDEDRDVALLRIKSSRLRPVQWTIEDVALGQWAVTPGIVETPHAVGVVSALPRKVRPPRAFMGIQFEFDGTAPLISQILPGLGAEAAGLKSGDLIQGINQTVVTNREQVTALLRDLRDGQTISVRVRRGEEEITADVRLKVPAPDDPLSASSSPQRAARLSGAVSQRADGFEAVIQHDTVLPPWLCGGPLVNLDGKAMGLNIARAGRVATYALPARTVKTILEQLTPRDGATRPSDN
jgi:serine protease Do